jgi:carbon storage regulator CsrA
MFFNQGGFSMLVLSRKNGESVQIGDSIEVKVLEVSGGRVKLGFSAPPAMAIKREEIHGAYPHPFTAWVRGSAANAVCSL